MKVFKSTLIVISILLSVSSVKAHQPDISSTMLIEQSPGKWLVQIRAALTAFEYEINMRYGENSYASSEEFEQLVLDHVKSNLFISMNDQKIEILNGIAKLGHETSVVFELTSLKIDDVHDLEVQNKTFANIPRNRSALMIHKEGVTPEQFMMDAKSDHAARLVFAEGDFVRMDGVAQDRIALGSMPVLPLVGGAAILIALGFYFIRRVYKTDAMA